MSEEKEFEKQICKGIRAMWDFEYNLGELPEANEVNLDKAASKEVLEKIKITGPAATIRHLPEQPKSRAPVRWATQSHPLNDIYMKAIEQALKGKGEERHGKGTSFMEQPWVTITQTHGLGFLTGQAEKKIREAMANRDHCDNDWFEKELLGALNYIAMALLYTERNNK